MNAGGQLLSDRSASLTADGGGRGADNSSRSATPLPSSGHDGTALEVVLKQRVAELEATLAREQNKFKRATAEHDTLTAQLLTARTNNDILSGNVEALKALSTQLATQLETARDELQQVRDQTEASDLKLRRDTAQELVAMEQACDAKMDALRQDLEAQQRLVDELRDANRDADVRAEIEAARVGAAKDAIIVDLRREMHLLQGRLQHAEQKQQQQQTVEAQRSPSASTPPPKPSGDDVSGSRTYGSSRTPRRHARTREQAGFTGQSSSKLMSHTVGPFRAAMTPWDTAQEESEVSAAHRRILDVSIAIDREHYQRARWRGLAAAAMGAAGAAPDPGRSKFHIDVVSDGSFVDTVPFHGSASETGGAVPHGGTSVPRGTVVASSTVELDDRSDGALTGDEYRARGQALFASLVRGANAASTASVASAGSTSFASPVRPVRDTCASERCAFHTASGEEVRVTVEIVPLVSVRSTDP